MTQEPMQEQRVEKTGTTQRYVTREEMDSTTTGQHLRVGEFVLPINPGDSTVDGSTWLEVVGTLVKIKVYSASLGRAVEFIAVSATDETLPATTDLKDVLIAAGLIEDGGASPLNLDEGTLSAGVINAINLNVSNQLAHEGGFLGFYGTAPGAKQTITGSKGGNVALNDLLISLDAIGLITDSSSA